MFALLEGIFAPNNDRVGIIIFIYKLNILALIFTSLKKLICSVDNFQLKHDDINVRNKSYVKKYCHY